MLIMPFECSFGKWGLGLSLCHLLCCGFVELVSPFWLRIHFINTELEGKRCSSIIFIKTHRKDCAYCVLTVDCHGRIYNIIIKKQELRTYYVECWKYWWWKYIYNMVSIVLFSLHYRKSTSVLLVGNLVNRNVTYIYGIHQLELSYSIENTYIKLNGRYV